VQTFKEKVDSAKEYFEVNQEWGEIHAENYFTVPLRGQKPHRQPLDAKMIHAWIEFMMNESAAKNKEGALDNARELMMSKYNTVEKFKPIWEKYLDDNHSGKRYDEVEECKKNFFAAAGIREYY